MTQDDEHLRLLSIFHYVFAVFNAVFASIPIIHVIIGLTLLVAPNKFGGHGEPPPAFIGLLFVMIGSGCILLGWTAAIFIAVSGKFLAQRRRYTFCFVIACIECLFVPFGTVLGIFTIIVLGRESVKQLFKASQPMPAPSRA
jgi:hypothetical protein